MKLRAFDQILLNRVDLRRGGGSPLKLVEPHGNVIRMRVEILGAMDQPPKGDPGRKYAGGKQGGDHKSALFNNIVLPFVNGVVIKVIFIMTDLPGEGILFAVGGNNDLERTRAETGIKSLTGHFLMDGHKHLKIISEASIKWL